MTEQHPDPPGQASHGRSVKSPSSEQGGGWERAGRLIGRFAGKAGSLWEKAAEVAKVEYEKAQQREGDGAIQRIWDQARECVRKGADEENVERLRELASLVKENTSELSEGAAERIARIYTDCTGHQVTAAEVKRVALRFGVMVLVTFVTATVLGRGGAAQNLFAQVREAASESGAEAGKGGVDDSLEDRTARFFSSEVGEEASTADIADAIVVDLG